MRLTNNLNNLSSEELELLLKQAQKEEREAKAKTRAVLSNYNQARQVEGATPRPSASITETSNVLINLAKDTHLSNVYHLSSVIEGKGKPDNWVEEVLDNKPYGFKEAHKRASYISKDIKRAKSNGKLKGASLRGIATSSSLKVALNEYRNQLTESERIDNLESMLIEVKLENDKLKQEQRNLAQKIESKDIIKVKCVELLEQGISAYKVHQKYKDVISYTTVKRLKSSLT